ncbi:hypothetical protein LOK49_LG07G00471 [Camellia lanceoleosa]|uniref:Uncharacterized protein n=1 Tax=Camellia lanceoleosa TaxID=1840588 RepID=A0ACC0H9P5_9ERIC|nr:hypothetical protein LOK49_LG07G00471 [Camellia lanceoleosa]
MTQQHGSSHCNGVATSCNDNSKCNRESGNGKEDDDEVEVELAVELDTKAELAPVERGSIMKEVERQVNGINDITVSRVIETGSGLGNGDIGGACMEMERRLSDFQIQGEDEGSCQVASDVDCMGHLKSLSGSELQRPSINLEVVIGPTQDNGLFNGVGGVCVNHATSNGLDLVEDAIVSKDNRAGQLSLLSEQPQLAGSDMRCASSSRNGLQNEGKGKEVIVVGDGSSILFWTDKWIGQSSLEHQFPRLFGLSTEPLGSLKWFVDEKNANGRWILTFKRPLRAWEEEELFRLFQILGEGPELRVNREDHIRWLSSSSGIFQVQVVGLLLLESV